MFIEFVALYQFVLLYEVNVKTRSTALCGLGVCTLLEECATVFIVA